MATRRRLASPPTAPGQTRGSSGPNNIDPMGATPSGPAAVVGHGNPAGDVSVNRAPHVPSGALAAMASHQLAPRPPVGISGAPHVGGGGQPHPPMIGKGPMRRPFGR